MSKDSSGGFFKGPNSVFDAGLNPFQIAVYLYLTRCSNNKASAFPSYNTIAEKCGMKRRKAIDVVKELESMGLLKKELRHGDGKNQSNVYVVVYPSAYYAPPSACQTPPSAQYAPNKELDYKEKPYKEKNYIDLPIDDHSFMNIYLKYFNETFHKPHMKVTEEQLEFINDNINKLHEYDIAVEDFYDAVVEHFDNLAKNNNGSILSFIRTFPRYFEIFSTDQDYKWKR